LQCPNSEAAYTTLRELQLHRAVFLDPNGFVKDGDLLNHIERELCEMCYQKENNAVATVCQEYLCSERTGRGNCYIATGNWKHSSCADVPFRELAHSINAFALNGSEMNITFENNLNFNHVKDVPEREILLLNVSVPNAWFIQTAVELNMAINDLPAFVRDELKLSIDESPPYPSITQVFDQLYDAKCMDFIRATTGRWPWQLPTLKGRQVPLVLSPPSQDPNIKGGGVNPQTCNSTHKPATAKRRESTLGYLLKYVVKSALGKRRV
jgi:hypothetical protein